MYKNFDTNCNYCPRNCNTNRYKSNNGYCKTDYDYYISSIFSHKGEEPPISGNKGICNVFYAHCNLQCVYCQNYQISDNRVSAEKHKMPFDIVIKKITDILDTGIDILGFVSPSHFVPQTIQIIEKLKERNYHPTTVYNTNAYDKVESLKLLEKHIDIYIPDFKYSDTNIAKKYSFVSDYPSVALNAIKEMYRQKGHNLYINKTGYAESGIIIRHLILPNNVQNSINILHTITKNLSKNIHISLMSQYYPAYKAQRHPELLRPINSTEYLRVVNEAKKIGLTNGWIQKLESNNNYRPNFEKNKPF